MQPRWLGHCHNLQLVNIAYFKGHKVYIVFGLHCIGKRYISGQIAQQVRFEVIIRAIVSPIANNRDVSCP